MRPTTITLLGTEYHLIQRTDGPGFWTVPVDGALQLKRFPRRWATGVPWDHPDADPEADLRAVWSEGYDLLFGGRGAKA